MGSDDLFKKSKAERIFGRKVGTKGKPKDSFLIVCEGKKTEPLYFDSFRVKTASIKVLGLGCDPLTLVEETINLKSQGTYDQVWCVFDRDNFPEDRVREAFELAKKNRIDIAYSNESFELWYLLHFHYYNTALSRSSYEPILSNHLGYKYEKNNPQMYEILLDRQPTAIKLAEKLLSNYSYDDPIHNNPQTTVHLLVKQLNIYI
ncbi:MAG TPA: RloB family protein [Bacillales bacterium]|nr:RloB family protein [Bacillales bacterium]